MLFEFGYNNTDCLKFIIKEVRHSRTGIDIFYTGTDIVNTARMTGNSTIHDLVEQKELIHNEFPKAKLYLVANDIVLYGFDKSKFFYKLKNLLEEVHPDGIIIANPILLYLFNELFSQYNIDIIISTIAGIDSIAKLEQLLKQSYYFGGIVVPISLNRNIALLQEFKNRIGSRKLILIPNEGCSPSCINRIFHFISHSLTNVEFSNTFVEKCTNDYKATTDYFLKTGIIVPSMLSNELDDIVDIIKLPNRHLTEEKHIKKTIKQLVWYQNRKDPANFFELIGFDVHYTLKTNLLKELFVIWRSCKNQCHQCNRCNLFTKYIKVRGD